MTQEVFNIQEVSKKLNVHSNTLRNWEKVFNINVQRNKNSKRIYDYDAIALLEKVKSSIETHDSIEIVQKLIKADVDVFNMMSAQTTKTQRVEMIHETPSEEKVLLEKFLKPLTNKIDRLEIKIETLQNEKILLLENYNTQKIKLMTKHNDDTVDLKAQIKFLEMKNQELEKKLSQKKWWTFWKD